MTVAFEEALDIVHGEEGDIEALKVAVAQHHHLTELAMPLLGEFYD